MVFKRLFFIAWILLLSSASLQAQKIADLDEFIRNVGLKKQADSEVLGCFRFSVAGIQVLREDSVTVTAEYAGTEIHGPEGPIVRQYTKFFRNGIAVPVPAPDTLRSPRKPAFYDEKWYRNYGIRDHGYEKMGGKRFRKISFIPLGSKIDSLMKGEVWIDPETFGIIKMATTPARLKPGITKQEIEIFNTYGPDSTVIRFGMHTVQHISTSDKRMEIVVRERYENYRELPDSICAGF